ncbi:OmpP1/FadL family transporter [candidate division KSB1 bacterium]
MKKLIAGVLVFSVILSLGSTNIVKAQSDPFFAFRSMSFLTEETGFGAKAIGMGGAFISVADDYSAVYWNPAGLALIDSKYLSTSLTHNNRGMETRFLGNPGDYNMSKTAFGSLGYLYSMEVIQGSLVFAGGYNRVHNYNSLFGYGGFNPGETYVGRVYSDPVIPNSLTQDESVEIDGNLSQFTFSGAWEAAENVFVGASLNYWTGSNNYSQSFGEFDLDDLYFVNPNDFNSVIIDNIIETDISGYDLKVGGLIKYTPELSIGLTMQTPRYISLREDWAFTEVMEFDNGDQVYVEDDAGEFEYKVMSPFKFGAGVSYNFKGGVISGDVEFIDWTQFKYRDDFPVDGYSKIDANRNIKRTLRSVFNPRVGIEIHLNDQTRVRAGFTMIQSPLKDAEPEMNRKFLSVGLGIKSGESSYIDVAYRRGTWETTSNSDFSLENIKEKHMDHRFFATLNLMF